MPRTAAIGVSMSVAGLIGLVALMGSAPMTSAMVAPSADRAEMIALTDRYEASWLVGVWIGLMLIGWTFGPLILAIGLWRSGWSPLIPVLLATGVVLMVIDAGAWMQSLALLANLVGLGLVAARLRQPAAVHLAPTTSADAYPAR